MLYELTPTAEQDVRDIYEFGRITFGEKKADEYFLDFYDAFERIGENPRAHRERHEIEPPARVHVFHSHLIFYKIDSDRLIIGRILHSRADWQSGLDS
jgi:toxin ParE1/3/4